MKFSCLILCMTLVSLDSTQAQNPGVFGLVLGQGSEGVDILRVLKGSPAETAGIHAGERLLVVANRLIRTPLEGRALLYRLEAGKPTELRVKGKAGDRMVTVTPTNWTEGQSFMAAKPPLKAGAPMFSWWGEQWDLPKGMKLLPTLESTAGKVVVLHLFQAMCPMCISHGLPMTAALEQSFADAFKSGDLSIIQMHGVAEAHRKPGMQFASAVKKVRAAKSHAVVLEDVRSNGSGISETWRLGGAKWSPWIFVVGRNGKLAYAGNLPKGKGLEKIVKKALAAPAPRAKK